MKPPRKQAVLGEYANGNKIIHHQSILHYYENNMLKGEAFNQLCKTKHRINLIFMSFS